MLFFAKVCTVSGGAGDMASMPFVPEISVFQRLSRSLPHLGKRKSLGLTSCTLNLTPLEAGAPAKHTINIDHGNR